MTTGRCLRCRAEGHSEYDHPDGRIDGFPIFPDVVDPLCPSCHIVKGRMDRAARVEGGEATLRVIVGRRATWLACLASNGEAIVMPAQIVTDFAMVLALVARQVPRDWPFDTEA